MAGLRFTVGSIGGSSSGTLVGQPGFFDYHSMMLGHWQRPTGTCGCCEEDARVCWNRYDNAAISNLGNTAPNPLGGPTESTPGSGIFASNFWELESGTAAPATITGQQGIHITADGTIVRNKITLNKIEMKAIAGFQSLDEGNIPRLFFNKVDADNYCYFEFVCTDGFPEIGLYKVENGDPAEKVRRKFNSAPGITFDGSQDIVLRVSLSQGHVLCTISSGSISADKDYDDTGTKPKVSGVWVGDHDDSPGNQFRPLELSAKLPILSTDTTTSFTGDETAIGGDVGAGGTFDLISFQTWNTNRNAVAGDEAADCFPDIVCSGMVIERPIRIGIHGDRVVHHGKRWIDCTDIGPQLYQDDDPGGTYELDLDCTVTEVNAAIELDFAPQTTGSPDLCHYEASLDLDGQCTDYHACGDHIPETNDIPTHSEIELTANGFTAYIAGSGADEFTAGILEIVVPTPPNGPIGPSYWHEGHVEGKQLTTTHTAPGDPVIADYTMQRIFCDSIIFEDGD